VRLRLNKKKLDELTHLNENCALQGRLRMKDFEKSKDDITTLITNINEVERLLYETIPIVSL